MSWNDVYGFPEYEPDNLFGDDFPDNEPDNLFGGSDFVDYDEPDNLFGNDFPDYEPDNLFGNDDFPDYDEPAYFLGDNLGFTEAMKSSSSSVGPRKIPSENKRKVTKRPSNTDNDKGRSRASKVSSSRSSTMKKFGKKSANEQSKRTSDAAPAGNNQKKTQSPMKDHQKNQPFAKHRKTPKKDLTGAIRKFSASKVKIPKENTKWARKMADTHIEYVRQFCQEKSKGIFNHFEFTGSFYEHLKTEDANELDILVALDTKNNADLMVEEVADVPGYALIKVTKKSSKYWRFVDNKGYVRPTKVRSWFFGLVQQAVNQYKKNKSEKDPELKPSDNGPATKLLINDKEANKKLEVDLVPAFLFKPKKESSLSSVPAEGRHYVAKQLPEKMITPKMKCTREMLWRQSFSLQEKKKMENLDKKDSGCRREVVKVMKTIVKNDSTLAKLSSYHIKTAFLHYNFDDGLENLEWSGKDMGERLKGLMGYLKQSMSDKNLSHFFINELNLLKELSDPSLENIEGRLNKLITSESELRRVLAVQPEELNAEVHDQSKLEAKKKAKKSKRQGQAKTKTTKTARLKSKVMRVKTARKSQQLNTEMMTAIFQKYLDALQRSSKGNT